jgi:hypothetical protein
VWDTSARAAFTSLLPEGHPFPAPNPDRVRGGLANDELSLLVADDGGVVGFTGCGTSRDPEVGPDVGEI